MHKAPQSVIFQHTGGSSSMPLFNVKSTAIYKQKSQSNEVVGLNGLVGQKLDFDPGGQC